MNDKRLYGIYIYNILTGHATVENPLTVKQIAETCQKVYDEKIDEVTIQRYINSIRNLENHTLDGDWKKGFYLINNDVQFISNDDKFLDEEIELLITLLRTTRKIKNEKKRPLIEKLCDLYNSKNLQEFYDYFVLEKDKVPRRPINEKHLKIQHYLFHNLVSVITEKNPIILEGKSFGIKNGKKFNCYAFIPEGDITTLVGTYDGVSAVFISLNSITNYKIIYDENFNKTPLTLNRTVYRNRIINFLKINYPNDFIINELSKKDIAKKIEFFNEVKPSRKERFYKDYYLRYKMTLDYSLFTEEEVKYIESEFEKYWNEQLENYLDNLLNR